MSKQSRAGLLTSLAAAAACGILLTTGAAPASAVDESPSDNGGSFLTEAQPKDDATAAELARQRAGEVHARTPASKLCTGTWTHAVSTVTFQRATGGTLAWGFKLSHTARANLGPTVTVTMPYAYVNGKAVNPPYGPHTALSTYNFHGSVKKYQYVGGGSGTIATGNKVTFYWFLKGSKPNSAADRYITCKVPKPGSA
ncbi:hypothetical protein [Streptomyces formicae]|uniref:Lipoprotein n=1 Tax=Streptomyces formicae TaxID=1616117 RepID=A0ABY3WJV7_9ACTN|nr:hypothetical protein [Streptomyces formicae]UNM11891.1 hypothetical protein J4032_10350 [Streptomyces formicae]